MHIVQDLICLEVQLNQIIDVLQSFLQATAASDRFGDSYATAGIKRHCFTWDLIHYTLGILYGNVVVPKGCTDAMTNLITNHLRILMEATPVQPPTIQSTKSLERMFWAAAQFALVSLDIVDKVSDSLSDLLLTLKQCTDTVTWRGVLVRVNSDNFWLQFFHTATFRGLQIPDSLDTSPPSTGDEIALGCAPRPLTFDEKKSKASIVDILPAILKRP